ncbi:YheC/YheD family protein [Alteribacter keqinensis]|uniref:ATP-grasp domain-containing protein n=1 Tax=Alteribacter keqinensis TaxID=2483800 RepID=A0A3M7TPK1_9BACI|nr:YheC/YheD family protein [Alteribacter keqinensis]RNA66216.1 hypothetical protein EBO34_18985 [Alteribacter keqinensis]
MMQVNVLVSLKVSDKMECKVVRDNKTSGAVTLPSLLAERINIRVNCEKRISFGIKSLPVIIKKSDDIKTVNVSGDIADTLNLPVYPIYSIEKVRDSIILGPYIGILASTRERNLKRKLMMLKSYVNQYAAYKGAILVFSMDRVNKKARRIKGYLYNPETKKWVAGNYSFPASIINRAYVSKKNLFYLESVLKGKIFNSTHFNKWQMYKMLKKFPEINNHLPETKVYKSTMDILHFTQGSSAYLKPLSGKKGKRILKIDRQDNGITISAGKGNNTKKYKFQNSEQVHRFVKKIYKRSRLIIQRNLNLDIIPGHQVDFRVVMVKDQDKHWNSLFIFGRKGARGNIVSNRSQGGKVYRGTELLMEAFNLDETEAAGFIKRMSELAILAAEKVDKSGHNMGFYGIDLGVDQNKKIWIIEMNNRSPNDNIGSKIGERKVLYNARYYNMMYARRLAGFTG